MGHGFPHRMGALASLASIMAGQGTRRNCFCGSSKNFKLSFGGNLRRHIMSLLVYFSSGSSQKPARIQGYEIRTDISMEECQIICSHLYNHDNNHSIIRKSMNLYQYCSACSWVLKLVWPGVTSLCLSQGVWNLACSSSLWSLISSFLNEANNAYVS